MKDLGNLPVPMPAAGSDELGNCTVQLGSTSLACMLAAVYTSHQLRLLGTAIVQQRKAAKSTLEDENQAGNPGECRPIHLFIEPTLESSVDLSTLAQTGPATVELEAPTSQTAGSGQQSLSAAPAGEDATASSVRPRAQSVSHDASLPGLTKGQEHRPHGSLGALKAADQKIAETLKSTEVTLLHSSGLT